MCRYLGNKKKENILGKKSKSYRKMIDDHNIVLDNLE